MEQDPTKPLRAVAVFDGAIDRSKTDITRYTATRDPSMVHALPGQHLRWAVLKPLEMGQMTALAAMPSQQAREISAFCVACIAIENHPAPMQTMSPHRPHKRDDGTETLVWTPDELQAVMRSLGLRYICEMGRLAYEMADSGNVWSGSVPYTLPLSSELALISIARHLAAQSAAIDGIASRSASASEATPTPPPSYAAGTPAPATEATSAPAASG